MKIKSCFFLIIILLFIAGCAEVTIPTITETGNNNISVRTVNDTLAVSIASTNHNYFQNIQLSFSVDTAKLNMCVFHHSSGTLLFTILRDTTVIFSRAMNSTFSISQQIFSGPPTNAVISLQNYSGNASILLTK